MAGQAIQMLQVRAEPVQEIVEDVIIAFANALVRGLRL